MTAAPGGSFNDSMFSYLAPNQAQMQQQAQMYQMQVLQAEIMKMQVSLQLDSLSLLFAPMFPNFVLIPCRASFIYADGVYGMI